MENVQRALFCVAQWDHAGAGPEQSGDQARRPASTRRRKPPGIPQAQGASGLLPLFGPHARALVFADHCASPESSTTEHNLFDDELPAGEQLPRHFEVEFRPTEKDGRAAIMLVWHGRQIGDVLTDNSHEDDGYRFHDVFHLAHAAVLGWSPMSRALFQCKRKSCAALDEVEDGGRAKILEEAICAIVFTHARAHAFFADVEHLGSPILDLVGDLTRNREVQRCSRADWERAILQGYQCWREMRAHSGGVLIGDLYARTVTYAPSLIAP